MRSSSRSSRRTKPTVDPDSKPRTARVPTPRTARTTRSCFTVTVTDGRGRPAAAPGLARWLAKVAPATARGEVAIALVSDARIRSMNKAFRRIDRPTDVLSFPSDAPPRASRLASSFLGDIVIATGVARRQARDADHSYADELKILALHGLLHLLGYDHHDPSDRGRMARMERRLRAKGGLYAGLIERVVRVSVASEPRKRPASARSASARSRRSLGEGGSAPAKRRASARVGESEGRRSSGKP